MFSVETDLYDNLFLYPQDVSHFLWLYKTSKFHHCNQTLAIEMEKTHKLYQNTSQLNLAVLPMRTVAIGLDKLEKHYWLAGGTLLGKENLIVNVISSKYFSRLVSTLWIDTFYAGCRFWLIC